MLVSLAQLPAIRNHDAAACAPYLAGLKQAFPEYLVIGAIDLGGTPFCASAPIPPGTNFADRPYFRQTIEKGEFTIGQYVVGPIAGKPLLPLALPFLGPDQRIAGASMS